MKKSSLLVLAVPAMLLTVSCGASAIVKQPSSLVRSTNAETRVSIIGKNCYVGESVPGTSSVITKDYEVGANLTFAFAVNPKVQTNAVLPEQKDVIFKVGDIYDSSIFTYTRQDNTNATLTFRVPEQEVVVYVDATVECMSFTVNVPEAQVVTFGFNGALDHVDWGDGSPVDALTHHNFEKPNQPFNVRVYGDLSSVWFTDRKGPASNGGALLSSGNKYIRQFSINHTITRLPDYALNGCQGISEAYIGESITDMGKEVFRMNVNTEKQPEGFMPKTIYCCAPSRSESWDEKWTDCPVCYGVTPDEAFRDHTDFSKTFTYKCIELGQGQRVAMITGPAADTKPMNLVIPETITSEDGKETLDVHSIAPFAFSPDVSVESTSIQSVVFAKGTGEGNKCVEIGDYAFYNNTKNLGSVGLENIIPDGPSFRIGRGAFLNCGKLGNIGFPTFTKVGPDLIIDDEAFKGTQTLFQGNPLHIPATSFTLKTVGDSAFEYSGITGIVDDNQQPISSITSIGSKAFANDEFLDLNLFDFNEIETMGDRVFYGSKIDSTPRISHMSKPEGWSSEWDVIQEDEETGELTRISVEWGFVKELVDGNFTYHITKKNVGEKEVKEIATLFKYNSEAQAQETITIPSSIKDDIDEKKTYEVVAIASEAFADCKNFNYIVVPASVKEVGRRAFFRCSPILKVLYKGSDISLWDEEWTFPVLEELDVGAALYINYSDTITPDVLVNKDFILAKENTPENGTFNASILKYVNAKATNEGEITIPAQINSADGKDTYDVTSIGGKSFFGADLTKGIIWETNSKLTSIGDGAFGAAGLPKAMTIPTSVTDVGIGAFAATQNVTSFDLSNNKNLTSIPMGAFAASQALTTVVLPEPEKDTEQVDVGMYAFAQCPALTTVDLSKTNMTDIPEGLFSACTSYKENAEGKLLLPTTMETIGKEAFIGTAISNADLSEYASLVSTDNQAFAACRSLTSVTLPAKFSKFGGSTFLKSENITSISFGKENESVVELPENSALFGEVQRSDEKWYAKLPVAFKTGDGKFWVKNKTVMEKYLKDPAWQKLFKDNEAKIEDHFDVLVK